MKYHEKNKLDSLKKAVSTIKNLSKASYIFQKVPNNMAILVFNLSIEILSANVSQ